MEETLPVEKLAYMPQRAYDVRGNCGRRNSEEALMEVNMLPLGRDRTARLALEEFESASKPASLFATPQQETI